jgi:hypothetical protein
MILRLGYLLLSNVDVKTTDNAPWRNLQPSNADIKNDAMWCFGASTTVEMNQRKNDVILRHVAVTTIGKEVP